MGNKQKDLQDISMELKIQARTLERQSQKLEAGEKAEKKRIQDVSLCFLRMMLTTEWCLGFK